MTSLMKKLALATATLCYPGEVNTKLVGWIAAAGLVLGTGALTLTLHSAEVRASDDAAPCTAQLSDAQKQAFAKLKKAGLERFDGKAVKVWPKGIKVTKNGLDFDTKLWSLQEEDGGVVSFAKKKKKKKKPKGDTYTTCLCGGSDTAGGCLTMVNNRTGKITCEDTGCENRGCGIAIFGDAEDLAAVGFEM